MEFERAIPGTELFLGELVDTASLLDRDPAATHGGDHRGLATDDPPLGARMWQLLQKPHPGHRISGRRFHEVAPSSTGSSAGRGPVRDRTGRKDSCMLAASLFYDPAFWQRGIRLRFTIFSRSCASCHQHFLVFESGASVCKRRCLKAGQIQRSGSDRSCKAYAETEASGGQITVSRLFHDQRPRFSRLVLASGANFTLV